MTWCVVVVVRLFRVSNPLMMERARVSMIKSKGDDICYGFAYLFIYIYLDVVISLCALFLSPCVHFWQFLNFNGIFSCHFHCHCHCHLPWIETTSTHFKLLVEHHTKRERETRTQTIKRDGKLAQSVDVSEVLSTRPLRTHTRSQKKNHDMQIRCKDLFYFYALRMQTQSNNR